VIVAKFTEGAWLTVLAIPGLILLMSGVRRHYETILRETECRRPANLNGLRPPIAVLPLQRWSKVAEEALRFAYTLSREVSVLHIMPEDEQTPPKEGDFMSAWKEYIESPAAQAAFTPPELVILRSPYRLVLTPIFEHILELERQYPDRLIAVLVPELVERQCYYYVLHNQRAAALKLILYLKGTGRIIVINVPWYLDS
jgi:hypothetical protein